MLIIITTMSLASATRHACDEDAARALKRPWAPVVFQLMRALRRSGGDVFIENAGATDGPSRVKILGVVSADCH